MSSLQNQQEYSLVLDVNNIDSIKIGIVYSEWHSNITLKLLQDAKAFLIKNGISENNIITEMVPGSFELIYGAKQMSKYVQAVICIGCVVQGDTKHFDFICQSVAQGVTTLNIAQDKPVVFGVLTVDTVEQAIERCGGSHGNKGIEAAQTALQMIRFKDRLLWKYAV